MILDFKVLYRWNILVINFSYGDVIVVDENVLFYVFSFGIDFDHQMREFLRLWH